MGGNKNIKSQQLLAHFLGKVESAIWWSFLGMVVGASFVSGGYIETKWLVFSGVFYVWFALLLVHSQIKPNSSLRAIKAALPIIFLMVVSLVWLLLQIILPLRHDLYQMMPILNAASHTSIEWFQPKYTWSVEPDRTRWLALSELLMLVVFVSTIWLVNSRKRLKQLLYVLVLLGVFHAGLGLFSKYSGMILVESKQLDGHWSAARGLFVNRNHFGAFLVLMSLGLFALILSRFGIGRSRRASRLNENWSKLTTFCLGLLFALSIFAIVSSQSRGALLSLILGFMVFLSLSRSQFQIARKSILFAFVLVCLLGIGIFGETLIQRLLTGAFSLGERTEQWRITVDAILANPFFGYGGGSYATVFQIFRSDVPLRDVMYAQAHNHYLHLWLERGLIGLLLWLIIFGLVLYRSVTMLKKVQSRLVASVLNGCLVILSAALIQSLVDYNLQNLTLRVYFFIAMALVYAAPYVRLR